MDWKEILDYNARSCSAGLIKYIVHSCLGKRLSHLGLEQWRRRICNEIERIPELTGQPRPEDFTSRQCQIALVYSKIALYEAKEALSLLELALWKGKLVELGLPLDSSNDQKRDQRSKCRVKCGSDLVLANVLPFIVHENYLPFVVGDN